MCVVGDGRQFEQRKSYMYSGYKHESIIAAPIWIFCRLRFALELVQYSLLQHLIQTNEPAIIGFWRI